jgi:hypothetical protein
MRSKVLLILIFIAHMLQGQENTIIVDSVFKMSISDAISDMRKSKTEISLKIEEYNLSLFANHKKNKVTPELINNSLSKEMDKILVLKNEMNKLDAKLLERSNDLQKLTFINEIAIKAIQERDNLIALNKSKYNDQYSKILAIENSGKYIDAAVTAKELKYEISFRKDLFSIIKPNFGLRELDSIMTRNERKYISEVRESLNSLIKFQKPASDSNYISYYENRIASLRQIMNITDDTNLKNKEVFNSVQSKSFLLEIDELRTSCSTFLEIYQLLNGEIKKINCIVINDSFNRLSLIKKQENLNETNFLTSLISCLYQNVTKSNSMKLLGKDTDYIKVRMVEYPLLYKNNKKIELICSEIPNCIKN